MLVLDLALQAPELLLLAPVIESGDEDNYDHSDEDGDALDPPRLRLRVVSSCNESSRADERSAREVLVRGAERTAHCCQSGSTGFYPTGSHQDTHVGFGWKTEFKL